MTGIPFPSQDAVAKKAKTISCSSTKSKMASAMAASELSNSNLPSRLAAGRYIGNKSECALKDVLSDGGGERFISCSVKNPNAVPECLKL